MINMQHGLQGLLEHIHTRGQWLERSWEGWTGLERVLSNFSFRAQSTTQFTTLSNPRNDNIWLQRYHMHTHCIHSQEITRIYRLLWVLAVLQALEKVSCKIIEAILILICLDRRVTCWHGNIWGTFNRDMVAFAGGIVCRLCLRVWSREPASMTMLTMFNRTTVGGL